MAAQMELSVQDDDWREEVLNQYIWYNFQSSLIPSESKVCLTLQHNNLFDLSLWYLMKIDETPAKVFSYWRTEPIKLNQNNSEGA